MATDVSGGAAGTSPGWFFEKAYAAAEGYARMAGAINFMETRQADELRMELYPGMWNAMKLLAVHAHEAFPEIGVRVDDALSIAHRDAILKFGIAAFVDWCEEARIPRG